MKHIIKIILLSCISLASCHQKGEIKDHKMKIIINDIPYHLYSVSDGQYKLRVLVPICENCKVPFATNFITGENSQTVISTVVTDIQKKE